ncbi:MAG: hypothetical protein ABSG43_18660 [Solirubrobacteraceae bacterium]|jgi:hypothetical protein
MRNSPLPAEQPRRWQTMHDLHEAFHRDAFVEVEMNLQGCRKR